MLEKLLGWRKVIMALSGAILSVVAAYSPAVAAQKDVVLSALTIGIPALLAIVGILANVILAIIRKEPIVIPEAPELEDK